MDPIVVEGLGKHFAGRPVLADLDLRVGAGEWLGVSGSNGAGKSTLLRVLAGLVAPDAGTVRVAGRRPERACAAGLVGWLGGSDDGLPARLRLGEELVFHARLRGVGACAARTRVRELARRLGFDTHLDVPAERCSSGIRRRAALARALLAAPAVLLLDEPLRSLDAPSRQRVGPALRGALADCTVVWVSHEPEELSLLCDRTAVLEKGALVACGAGRTA